MNTPGRLKKYGVLGLLALACVLFDLGVLFALGSGIRHLIEGISPGYGFIAVIVALLGKQNPVGVTIVAFFFSALLAGSEVMYRTLGVPVALAQTLQALVLVFVLIGELFLRWHPKWSKG